MDTQVKSLFEIQKEYLEIMENIMENDGLLSEEQEKALAISEEELLIKTNKYGYFLERLATEEKMLADKIKSLTNYKKHIVNLQKKYKENILNAMEVYGLDEIKTDDFLFKPRKSEAVEIEVEPYELDPKLRLVEIKPISKTEIKKLLKAGEEFEGVKLVQNKSLTIKSI